MLFHAPLNLKMKNNSRGREVRSKITYQRIPEFTRHEMPGFLFSTPTSNLYSRVDDLSQMRISLYRIMGKRKPALVGGDSSCSCLFCFVMLLRAIARYQIHGVSVFASFFPTRLSQLLLLPKNLVQIGGFR